MDIAVMIAVINDTRLSAEARAVVLHVFGRGPGVHEIGFSELRRLLNQAGEKRVRRAVRDAEELGWLTVVRGGNAGQYPRFTVNADPAAVAGSAPREAEAAELAGSASVADAAVVAASAAAETAEIAGSDQRADADPAAVAGSASASHVREHGDQKTSSSSPSPSARGREVIELLDEGPHLQLLREALGPFQSAVDQMLLAIPGRAESWAAAIYTSYLESRPARSPTATAVISRIPEAERRSRVAQAMTDYATQHKAFQANLFTGYVLNGGAANDDAAATRTRARSAHGGRAAAAVAASSTAQDDRRRSSFGG